MCRLALLLLVVAACGGGASPPVTSTGVATCAGPLAGEPLLTRPGARACTTECFEAHARACLADPRVWKIALAPPMGDVIGAIHIGANGASRLERPEYNLYGVDGRVWLACMPACGDASNVCAPGVSNSTLAILSGVDDCTHTSSPAPPWNGMPSMTAHVKCNLGEFDLRYVPQLLPVRDALIVGGLIDHDDPGVEIDGLVVGISYQDQAYDMFSEVVAEDCEALAIPADHQLHATLADYEAVQGVHERIWAQHTIATEPAPTDMKGMAALVGEVFGDVCAEYASGNVSP